MSIVPTLAISVVVGALITGGFALFQIPLNKRRNRAKQSNQDADFLVLVHMLQFLQDWKSAPLPSEEKDRALRRKLLINEVKDRMRIYESRRELDEIEQRK